MQTNHIYCMSISIPFFSTQQQQRRLGERPHSLKTPRARSLRVPHSASGLEGLGCLLARGPDVASKIRTLYIGYSRTQATCSLGSGRGRMHHAPWNAHLVCGRSIVRDGSVAFPPSPSPRPFPPSPALLPPSSPLDPEERGTGRSGLLPIPAAPCYNPADQPHRGRYGWW